MVTQGRGPTAAVEELMRRLRRSLHARPEVGLHLPATQDMICRALDGLDMNVTLGSRISSVVAIVEGNVDGPTVVLRADMDALEVDEYVDVEYRSTTPGVMHACGHDLHAAMLVGAAHILAAQRSRIRGRVALVWQPGEEGHDGMRAMLDEGLIEHVGGHDRIVAAFGLHVLSRGLPTGVFSGRSGASHASTGTFTVTIQGAGGHAGFPHETRDPVPVAAELVLALQSRVTRSFDVFDPVVITVSSIRAGTAPNAIPDSATVHGSARTFSSTNESAVEPMIRELSSGISAAHGLRVRCEYVPGYPPVLNDPGESEFVQSVVEDLFGQQRYRELAKPLPAGDDFSRLAELVPSAFVLLGAEMGIDDCVLHPNHSPHAEFDDSVMPDGASLLAEIAIRRLASATHDHE